MKKILKMYAITTVCYVLVMLAVAAGFMTQGIPNSVFGAVFVGSLLIISACWTLFINAAANGKRFEYRYVAEGYAG